VRIRFKSPATNNCQAGVNASPAYVCQAPAVQHVQLIVGEVTGKLTPGTDAYAKQGTNPTTRVVATYDPSSWTVTAEGYTECSFEMPDVQKSMYFRVRGNNLAPSTPFETDDQGNPLSGSTTTALIARWFLARRPGATIVHNLITSRAVPETVRKLGGTPVRTRVGHSFIKQVMAETGAVFGGEHSGHYYFADNFRADSGMLAMLVLLQVISEDGRPLSKIREEVEPYFASGEINLHVADQKAAMDRVAEKFEDADVDHLDGLTVSWPDRWFNLRPSNTEPLLRLNVEGPDPGAVDEMVAAVKAVIGN